VVIYGLPKRLDMLLQMDDISLGLGVDVPGHEPHRLNLDSGFDLSLSANQRQQHAREYPAGRPGTPIMSTSPVVELLFSQK
jgi:hypothetical protein